MNHLGVRDEPIRDPDVHAFPDAALGDLRLFIDTIRDYAIYALDAEGYVRTWNQGARRIKGYEADEIIGRHLSTFYPPEEAAEGKAEHELHVARQQGRFEEEGWRVRKDGSRFWASVVLTAVRDEGGALRGFVKITRDLTERRRAEEVARELAREQAARAAAERADARLRESEARYRDLSKRLDVILQGIADGITVQDRNGGFVYVNAAAAALCGFSSPDEMLRATRTDVIARFELMDEAGRPFPPDRLPGRAALRGEPAEPALLRVREKASGRERWSHLQATPVYDDGGQPELVVNIWRDVTAAHRRQEAESYLARASAALAASLDHAETLTNVAHLLVPQLADWCAVHVLEGGELRATAVAHRDPEKVAMAREMQRRFAPNLSDPRGVALVIRTGQSQLYKEISDELLQAGARGPEHLALMRSVGMRSAMVVPIQARGRVLGALTLIAAESERRYDEEDLALAEELGRRAGTAVDNARLYRDAQQAIALREQFLSIAGHELNTPLAALRLQLQSLQAAFERGAVATSPDRWHERLKKTLTHTDRLQRLVRELLDVSQITAGRLALERERFDMAQLAGEVVERHADELARAGSDVALSAAGGTIGLWDRSRIDQAITNLLTNAMKYGGGRPIDVAVEGRPGAVRVSLRDRGIGVRAEDQERIFGRFERGVSERNYGGLGLGLWIVREIVEAHGGRVWFERAPEPGSIFAFEIPLDPAGGGSPR